MKILALETSTTMGSIALFQDEKMLFHTSFQSEKSHNSQIFEALRPLDNYFQGSIDLLAVGIGPGSYTGVRVGIATAHGLSLAYNSAVIGMSSILSYSRESTYYAVGYARREKYYHAKIVDHKIEGEIKLCTESEIVDFCKNRQREKKLILSFDREMKRFSIPIVEPDARMLIKNIPEKLDNLSSPPLQPFYLSGPFITQSKKRKFSL